MLQALGQPDHAPTWQRYS